MIEMFLTGPFRVEVADGLPVNIRGRKTQGVLALLATAPTGRRKRTWLCDVLWDSHHSAHANASLRQTVSELKRVLSFEPNLIVAGRDSVEIALATDRVSIRETPELPFLAGLDGLTDRFDEWLQAERARRQSLR